MTNRTADNRAALVSSGWIECECSRTRRIPKNMDNDVLMLYVKGLIGPLAMPENPAPFGPDGHLCDPAWLREQVVALRATVAKRDQKIREIGIGMARLSAPAPDVCRPFDHRADCVSLHCLEKTPVVKRSEVWDSVEKNAAEVSEWPEWRRIGSGVLPPSAPAAPSAPESDETRRERLAKEALDRLAAARKG